MENTVSLNDEDRREKSIVSHLCEEVDKDLESSTKECKRIISSEILTEEKEPDYIMNNNVVIIIQELIEEIHKLKDLLKHEQEKNVAEIREKNILLSILETQRKQIDELKECIDGVQDKGPMVQENVCFHGFDESDSSVIPESKRLLLALVRLEEEKIYELERQIDHRLRLDLLQKLM